MKDRDLDFCVGNFVRQCEKLAPRDQLRIRPDVERVIDTLTSRNLPVPRTLRSLKNRLDDESHDDMFENMPV